MRTLPEPVALQATLAPAAMPITGSAHPPLLPLHHHLLHPHQASAHRIFLHACPDLSTSVVRVMTRGCCLSRCARLYYALLIAYCDSVSAAYCGSQSWALRRPQLLHMPIQHTQQQLMSLNLPLLQQATAQATAHTVQHVVAYCTSKSMLAHASLLQMAAYSIDLARWSVCKPSPSCCST